MRLLSDRQRPESAHVIIGCPVFVIHGKKDEIVPFWHGERLYRQAREPKMRLWVVGADHNNLVEVAAEEYWQGLERFTRLIGGNGFAGGRHRPG